MPKKAKKVKRASIEEEPESEEELPLGQGSPKKNTKQSDDAEKIESLGHATSNESTHLLHLPQMRRYLWK